MKLGAVTRIDKRNKTTSKKLTMTSCQKIVTSLLFFEFLPNLEQSGFRTESLQELRFQTKNENRTKKSLTHLSHYCFE